MRFPRDVRLSELAQRVFRAAAEGDRVARQMLDEMADEIVVTAIAAIRHLHVTTRDVHVVLGGGVFRSRDSRLMSRIRTGIAAVAPTAQIRRLEAPQVPWRGPDRPGPHQSGQDSGSAL